MTPEELKTAAEAQLETASAFILITVNEAAVMASACNLGTPTEQMAMAAQAYSFHVAITSGEAAALMADIMGGVPPGG